jgi:hypothetical protein
MVEAAAQLANGLSSDQREASRWLGVDVDFINSLSCLRVVLDDESIGVGIAEGLHPIFKITDVVLGPFDFRPDAD